MPAIRNLQSGRHTAIAQPKAKGVTRQAMPDALCCGRHVVAERELTFGVRKALRPMEFGADWMNRHDRGYHYSHLGPIDQIQSDVSSRGVGVEVTLCHLEMGQRAEGSTSSLPVGRNLRASPCYCRRTSAGESQPKQNAVHRMSPIISGTWRQGGCRVHDRDQRLQPARAFRRGFRVCAAEKR